MLVTLTLVLDDVAEAAIPSVDLIAAEEQFALGNLDAALLISGVVGRAGVVLAAGEELTHQAGDRPE